MKTKQVISSLLVLIGMVLGFFAIDEKFGEPMPWEVLFLVTPVAFLFVVALMSFVVILCSKRFASYFYWFILLFTVFVAGCGLGMVFQCLYLGQLSPTYFFTLFGAVGYLLGLPAIQKIAGWRYGSAF